MTLNFGLGNWKDVKRHSQVFNIWLSKYESTWNTRKWYTPSMIKNVILKTADIMNNGEIPVAFRFNFLVNKGL